jgi:hypothetical protein
MYLKSKNFFVTAEFSMCYLGFVHYAPDLREGGAPAGSMLSSPRSQVYIMPIIRSVLMCLRANPLPVATLAHC